LLADLLWREGGLTADELRRYWPMVKKAAAFVTQNGPVTGQDRWEEDSGYSPFTLAVEISALLAAADIAEHADDVAAAIYLRETADAWNEQIERWIYVTGTSLAHELGIDGYYVRIAPADSADACSPNSGFVPIKNRPPDQSSAPASLLVSPDALALVRFGLRAADDPRIRNTLRVIDALLKVELPAGPCWRRYNGDGYGEHADGRPFDGIGIGRPWPLLTGERAHYEIAAGNRDVAENLLAAMEAFASDGHLIPEQVWDSDDIPERELFRGRPSGSAMPLVWAHAEHIKLLRSLREERVFDMPPQPYQRYQVEGVRSKLRIWRLNQKCRTLDVGKVLRIELPRPALIHWSDDDWKIVSDTPTRLTPFGRYRYRSADARQRGRSDVLLAERPTLGRHRLPDRCGLTGLGRLVFAAQLRRGHFLVTLLLALETRLARPCAFQIVAHRDRQPAQAFGLDLDLVAILEGIEAAMIGTGGENIARLQRVDRADELDAARNLMPHVVGVEALL
jgi:glucoamylase